MSDILNRREGLGSSKQRRNDKVSSDSLFHGSYAKSDLSRNATYSGDRGVGSSHGVSRRIVSDYSEY